MGITAKLMILTISAASVNFGKKIGRTTGPTVIPITASMTDTNIVNFFKQVHSLYEQNRDLINVGAYQSGTDNQVDLAIKMHPFLLKYLSQGMFEKVTFDESYSQISELYQVMTTPDQVNENIEQS